MGQVTLTGCAVSIYGGFQQPKNKATLSEVSAELALSRRLDEGPHEGPPEVPSHLKRLGPLVWIGLPQPEVEVVS